MAQSGMFDLSGKVAAITGSSRGIGRAIAEAMAAQGAKVVVSSRKPEACDDVANGIRESGGEAAVIPCNISHLEQLDGFVEKAKDHFGQIDILVCNAAVNPYFGSLAELPESAYDKVMSTNVKSNLWLCNKVIPDMAERGDGVVIIVSSIAAFGGSQKLGVYGLSKAADVSLAQNLAVEWGPRNIRVNCINPGLIRTDFSRALWQDPETYEETVKLYPLRRIGEPDEIAGAAVFLASKAGSFMTGQTIVIDGGGMATL